MIRVVHLSDMHFCNATTHLTTRHEMIAKCVCPLPNEGVHHLVLLFNGDFANKGTPNDFDLARAFIDPLVRFLKSIKPSDLTLYCFITPGNHDCDFSGDQTMRDLALSTLEPQRPSSSVEETVLKPLNNYFSFVNDLSLHTTAAISRINPYFCEYRIHCGDHALMIYLINSSWMSKIHEKTNEATFPLSALPTVRDQSITASIAVMHHPLSWFRMPDTKTQLREWVEQHCDLLVTGHEHFPREARLDSGSVTVTTLEGGALQLNDTSSVFHMIDINLNQLTGIIHLFEYSPNDQYYRRGGEKHLTFDNLSSLAIPRALKPRFRSMLEDPLLPITIHFKNPVRLQDFFLYPDLNEYSNSVSPEEGKQISGSRLFETLYDTPLALLTGDEVCGKTALARHLVLAFHAKGKLPILIDAKDLKNARSLDQVRKCLDQSLRSQYMEMNYDLVQQKYMEQLVLVIDDFHLLYDTGVRPSLVREHLEQLAAQLVVIASDELVHCQLGGHGGDYGGFENYRKFQIREFGQLKVEALVSRWVILSNRDKNLSEESILKIVSKLTKQIQNVLCADVIPHQPWILLVLLHQTAEQDTLLLRNGSYGHMYQAIVTAALSRSKMSTLELNGKFAYLANLAYRIYALKCESISTKTAREVHEQHCRDVDIPLDFDATIADFVEAGILKRDQSGIRILSRYAMCFFLAWQLNRNLHHDWAKDEVRVMCRKLYDPISANTLLFLAYLDSSPFATDTVLDAAKALFSTCDMTDFTADFERLNTLGGVSDLITIPASEPADNRQEFIERGEMADEVVVSNVANNLQMVAIVDPVEREGNAIVKMHEIQSAYRMIRILGQIVKNQADAAESSWKVNIVSEIYRLSRRMLGSAFEELKDVKTWRAVAAVRMHRHLDNSNEKASKHGLHSKFVSEKLTIKANREITGICWLACFSVVKIVGEATGARALAGTFEKVLVEDPAIPNRLFQLDVLMEHGDMFPLNEALSLKTDLRNDSFGIALLKSLIAHHFYLYRVRFDVRQSVCAQIGIGLDGVKAIKADKKRPGRQTNKRLPEH